MQLSYFFRRGIVVPLDSQAYEQLASDNVDSSTAVRHLSLDDDADFYPLFVEGVIERINRSIGSTIDEYEDELIEHNKVGDLLNVITDVLADDSSMDDRVRELLTRLISLLREANERGMPVFFVF